MDAFQLVLTSIAKQQQSQADCPTFTSTQKPKVRKSVPPLAAKTRENQPFEDGFPGKDSKAQAPNEQFSSWAGLLPLGTIFFLGDIQLIHEDKWWVSKDLYNLSSIRNEKTIKTILGFIFLVMF